MGSAHFDDVLFDVLLATAWVDGGVAQAEVQILEGVLHAMGASPKDAAARLARARDCRLAPTLQTIDLSALIPSQRRDVYRAAVLLVLADGVRHAAEDEYLDALADRLEIGAEARPSLEAESAEWAARLLGGGDALGRDRHRVSVCRDRARILGADLKEELTALCAPSYVDATAIVARGLDRCDTLYEKRDDAGRCLAFFMTSWAPLLIEGCARPAVYLGLGVTSAATKSTGLIRRLFAEFLHDARAKELASGQRLVLWATTATPAVYLAMQRLFDDVEPRPDASTSEEGRLVAAVARTALGAPPARNGDHPFLLRGVAGTTRYSAAEYERIQEIARRKDVRLLEAMRVDERNGDRTLLVCRVPRVGSA